MKNVTGITVCHNTKDLIKRAYESVRKWHPDMEIMILDGSDGADPCRAYVQTLQDEHLTVCLCSYNIGHGRGMHELIKMVNTQYALIFDSDIEMLKSPVEAMLKMMESDTYGVGYTEKTGLDGYEYGAKQQHVNAPFMKMLHPYFALIQVSEYFKFAPFVMHGAPWYKSALDIHRRGLTSKIIKEFPGLGHSSGKGWVWTGEPREFIRHDTRGTRDVRIKKHLPEIEPGWDYSPLPEI